MKYPVFFITLLGLTAILHAQEAPGRLTFHAAPKPLNAKAVTSDWPRFLGPNDDGTTPETHLLAALPETGLKLVWELAKGDSFTGPSIVGDRLVFFHNIDDQDIIECLHPETGKPYWVYTYPNRYRDRYGYGKGPRASPVIAGEKIYTLSATSILTCLDLKSGQLIWKRDLAAEYELSTNFFGHGCSPIVMEDKVIVPLGGKGVAVAAFQKDIGETMWETKHEWPASYASPIKATLHGKERVLVFAGGDSDPPTGGLLCIDPKNGKLDDAFSWRATKYESVNASTPKVIPGNRVLISETYSAGGVLLEFDESFKMKPVWESQELKLHWMTPLYQDGYFYAFTGRNPPDAGLDCWDAATGERKWREEWYWQNQVKTARGFRNEVGGYFRGTLVRADGRNYALGEFGTLGILQLTPEGGKVLSQVDLFKAEEAWTMPVISRGLLYVVQNRSDGVHPTRLLCYDFRAE